MKEKLAFSWVFSVLELWKREECLFSSTSPQKKWGEDLSQWSSNIKIIFVYIPRASYSKIQSNIKWSIWSLTQMLRDRRKKSLEHHLIYIKHLSNLYMVLPNTASLSRLAKIHFFAAMHHFVNICLYTWAIFDRGFSQTTYNIKRWVTYTIEQFPLLPLLPFMKSLSRLAKKILLGVI